MLETTTEAGPAPPPAAVDAGRTIRRFYTYRLASEAQFISAIWIIFLRSRGFSLTEVGLAESGFHLAPVLLELPSGSFADLVGRRWSMAIGALLVALSSSLLWSAHSLPLVMLAMFLHGASFSFRSGADQAYLYEALGERQTNYAGIFGRLLGGIYIVSSATAWLGAALSDIDYGYSFALTVGLALAGAWLAAGLYEPPRQRHAVSVRDSIRAHARDARQVLSGKPAVNAMLLFSGPFWAASTIAFLYLQAAFSERGLSNGEIGLVVGVVGAINAIGATTAARLGRRGTFRQQVVSLSALTGAGIAGIAFGNIWVAIGAYLLANLTSGWIEPLLFAWFNQQLPSEQRATLLSVESWLFSVTMIVCFPAAGWLAQSYSWAALYALLGGVKLTLAAIVLLSRRTRLPAP